MSLERTFSVEMTSKAYIKNLLISNESHSRVLVEGNLGKLQEVLLVEGDVLEIIGTNGVLRIDLTESELEEVLKTHRKSNLSSQMGSSTNSIQMR